jgi:hypothetical protein
MLTEGFWMASKPNKGSRKRALKPAAPPSPSGKRPWHEWTLREMRLLERHYLRLPVDEFLARYMPYRTVGSVRARATSMNLRRARATLAPWTTSDDKLLRKHYRRTKISDIRKQILPQRTRNAIVDRANFLGLVVPMAGWTSGEMQALKKHFGKLPIGKLITTHLPGRTARAIRAQAFAYGLTKKRPPAWRASEDRLLKKHYQSMPTRELKSKFLPNRDLVAIRHRARALNLTTARSAKWSAAEDEFLRRNFKKLSDDELVAHFSHRTVAGIRIRALRFHGLSRRGPRIAWSEADLALIRMHYLSHGGVTFLAKEFACSRLTVLAKATELGIHRAERQTWSAAETAQLRRLYPTHGKMAPIKGRTPAMIAVRAHKIGLKRRFDLRKRSAS